MAKLFLSEQLDLLAEGLSQELQSDGYPPLHPRTILIPTQKLKTWLMLSLAKHHGVASCRVFSVEEVMKNRMFPSGIEMFGSIYSSIKKSQRAELLSYSQGKEKRIIELSEHLSSLFFSYGRFGLEKEGQSWQRDLFKELPWDFSSDLKLRGPVHCFGCDFLPEMFWEALLKIEPLSLYLFSPCVYFWEDLCTPFEKKKLIRKSSQKIRPQLESYLSEAPPLLANWGKLGRETLKILDCYDFEVTELYGATVENSALSVLKNTLLFMEPSVIPADSSVRVFQTGASKLREIEILKENIEDLFKKGIDFSEMNVLAPDMDEYIPLIEFVFGNEIPYRILDIEVSSKSHFLQAIKALLNHEEPLKIFENPSLYLKQNWDQKKLVSIRKWLEMGVDRTLNSLLDLTDTDVTWSDADLIEEMIELDGSIHEDFQCGEKTCAEWAEFLERVAKKYLVSDEMGEAPFQSLLKELSKSRLIEKFDAPVILHLLNRSSKGSIHPSSLHSVRFGSIEPGSLTPCRALFMIGMDEESFPRKEIASSLDLLKKEKKFVPRAKDLDRNSMLQALFSAQEYLYFSYGHLSGDEGKSIGPSLALQELLSEIKTECIKTASPLPSTPSKTEFLDFFRLDVPFADLPTGEITVFLSDLAKLARHPWEFYLQMSLGISLEKKKIDSFPAQKSWFAKETLQEKFVQTLKDQLPPGLVGKAQELEIEKTSRHWEKLLKEWNLEISTWTLLESCREKKWAGKLLEIPPLIIDVTENLKVKIVGNLKMMSEQGLVTTTDEILRVWPEWLTASIVSGQSNLFVLKKGKIETLQNPTEALRSFLIYYFRALSHPSPLLSHWADFFLKDGKKEKNYYEDPVMDWVLSRTTLPSDERLFEKWDWLKETFGFATV